MCVFRFFKITLLLPVLTLWFSTMAFADQIEGLVQMVGAGFQAKVILKQEEGGRSPSLCRSDDAKTIGKLSGLSVRVDGVWKLRSNGKKICFNVSSYEVTKTSNGTDAVVGILKLEGGQYMVATESGKVWRFPEIPRGMKDAVGKKIILEVSPLGRPSTKEARYKVVTYMEHP